MTNDQILEALNAYQADPEFLAHAVAHTGTTPTGDAAADVRAIADHYDLDVEQVLYGLFDEDSPLFK